MMWQNNLLYYDGRLDVGSSGSLHFSIWKELHGSGIGVFGCQGNYQVGGVTFLGMAYILILSSGMLLMIPIRAINLSMWPLLGYYKPYTFHSSPGKTLAGILWKVCPSQWGKMLFLWLSTDSLNMYIS